MRLSVLLAATSRWLALLCIKTKRRRGGQPACLTVRSALHETKTCCFQLFSLLLLLHPAFFLFQNKHDILFNYRAAEVAGQTALTPPLPPPRPLPIFMLNFCNHLLALTPLKDRRERFWSYHLTLGKTENNSNSHRPGPLTLNSHFKGMLTSVFLQKPPPRWSISESARRPNLIWELCLLHFLSKCIQNH